MTRWLVQFGYDGLPFAGWARQPRLRTVEGEILSGLPRCGVVRSAPEAELQVASRTDRGVSARANAITVRSDLSGTVLLRALNGIAPEVFFTRASEVPDSFRVRAAEWREYRYLLPRDEPGLEKWPALLPLFTGRPIDVRSLARGVPGGEPCWREIESIQLEERGEFAFLRLRARGFLWGMVRNIVGTLRGVGTGRIEEARLRQALEGRERLTLPLAEGEPLLLWEVHYALPWQVSADRRPRRQAAWFDDERRRARLRSALLDQLVGGPQDPQ